MARMYTYPWTKNIWKGLINVDEDGKFYPAETTIWESGTYYSRGQYSWIKENGYWPRLKKYLVDFINKAIDENNPDGKLTDSVAYTLKDSNGDETSVAEYDMWRGLFCKESEKED